MLEYIQTEFPSEYNLVLITGMPRKRIDEHKAKFDLKMTEIAFKVMEHEKELSADTVYEYCRKELLPPKEISSRQAGMFRRLKASGYIKATGRCLISSRNASSLLPIYVSTIYKDSLESGLPTTGQLDVKEHENTSKP